MGLVCQTEGNAERTAIVILLGAVSIVLPNRECLWPDIMKFVLIGSLVHRGIVSP